MFAIVDFKGFQYRVEKDATIKVSYLADAEIGSTVEIPNVLLIQNDDKTTVGTPTVESAKVTAEVLGHGRDKKIIVFKKKRRKGYRKTQGHRQHFTQLKITDIQI
ncbi:MAG: 50S ribosomal protein L21 [Candidatus Cloacimonadales bacterium]|jgi:large subunit ribosomal protein L21|nr:50S ribosomal protein L21 [Candidatus Cloacimonadota bacterium]MDX9977057.1 50S ribosomal protein L21 [Candidatus Cloacimonadales bacterium]